MMNHKSTIEALLSEELSASTEGHETDLAGLYQCLRYLEDEASLAGLNFVATIIGVAAMGVKDEIDGPRGRDLQAPTN